MVAMSEKDAGTDLQARIAAADEALSTALDARAAAVRELLEFRRDHADAYVPMEDDASTIRRAIERAQSFPAAEVDAVFREVLGATASLEAERRVAYGGERGGFAELAARRHFGHAASLVCVADVQAVIDEVLAGRAAFGVLPFETSSDGAVTATLNGLANYEVSICAERTVAADYHLLSQTGNVFDIEKIYGPAAGLAAAGRYLLTTFPRATLLDVPSVRVAAELALTDHGAGALSIEPDEEVGLRVVAKSVQDEHGRHTRFAIVGRELPSRTGRDRTVVAMALGDRPGALHAVLAPFADRSINLTRLESRPARGSGIRYRFFVEMDGHITDRPLVTALDRVRELCPMVKVLGSYPRPD